MGHKIGVGVITCNREDFFKKCINSIPSVDTLVVINDGLPYPKEIYPDSVKEVIQHTTNKSVGISKNQALRYLMQDNCDHLFLIEDDMIIKRADVFEKYIKTAAKSGIWHLNFGYHGPANKTPDGRPNPRQVIDYGDGIEVAFNPNCVGSFSYYYKGIIKNIGYIDERLINCWDHVEHTMKIIKAGLHPPFWWFADVANSYDYIGELACSTQSTTITRTPEWMKNFQQGALLFQSKYGNIPTKVPDTSSQEVLQVLEKIQKNYSKEI